MNVGSAASVLEPISRVATVAELTTAISAETNLIILDRSALASVRESHVLYEQLKQGRSLIGLNISLEELRALSRFDTAVVENRIDGRGPSIAPAPPMPTEDFYSVLKINRPGAEARRFGQAQRLISGGILEADIGQLSDGAYDHLHGSK